MSTLKTNAVLDADGGTTATVNGYTPTASNMAGRNRIINGNMAIDQRNAGASVTPIAGQYSVDRFICNVSQASKYSIQQNAGAVTPPAGFSNYLGVTSLAATSVAAGDYFYFAQRIEGFNTADFAWGTASAQAITLSFWVRSSLTGTFGGALSNNANTRSYPFTYTISTANTWEFKTITIPGDTTGTWLATNGIGVEVIFGLGLGSTFSGTAGAWAAANYLSATGATSVVGTSGATFYITGVQLEKGSTATDFEYRPYGTELALCQRYLPVYSASDASSCVSMASGVSPVVGTAMFNFPTSTRVPPTSITLSSASHFSVGGALGLTPTAITLASTPSVLSAPLAISVASGWSAGYSALFRATSASAKIIFEGCEL